MMIVIVVIVIKKKKKKDKEKSEIQESKTDDGNNENLQEEENVEFDFKTLKWQNKKIPNGFNQYEIKKLRLKADYLIRIRSRNKHGYSVWSQIQKITTKEGGGDKWSSSDKGDDMTIEKNGSVIKSSSTAYRSAWLKKTVKKGTHHWQFKIKGYGSNNSWDMVFGLCRSGECSSRRNTYYRGYGMISHQSSVGYRLHSQSHGSADGQWGQKLKVGDKVDIYLNFKKNSLVFVVNGTSLGNCVNGTIESNTYRMGIVSGSNQTKIQLITYDNARFRS